MLVNRNLSSECNESLKLWAAAVVKFSNQLKIPVRSLLKLVLSNLTNFSSLYIHIDYHHGEVEECLLRLQEVVGSKDI